MLACSQRTSTDHDILNRSCSGSQSKANEEDNKSLDKENEAEPGEKEIKDFVIIGNGPSGISLSYMLSGNLPYYTGQSQDDMLHSRLTVDPDLSLVEQDLEFLADGLEGRSNNPVSLLLDCLQRPQADLGLDLEPLLSWRSEPAAGSNHVVLGRGKPGGVWQTYKCIQCSPVLHRLRRHHGHQPKFQEPHSSVKCATSRPLFHHGE